MQFSRRSLLAGAGGLFVTNGARLPIAHAQSAGGLSFLVVGDWGEPDNHTGALKVAGAMAKVAEQAKISFVISAGDNFYETGVKDVSDTLWQNAFENIYSAPSLQCPWYVVLGNHDHTGSVQAQIDYSAKSRRWTMPAVYYSISKPVTPSASVDFFFLDTEPLREESWWERMTGLERDPARQLAWLEASLARSTAKWKILVGHHPIFSGGEHGDTAIMVERVKPLMEKYGAQIYMSGHDHDLEAIRQGPVTYLVSGAGSRTRPIGKHAGDTFSASQLGFMLLELGDDKATATFLDEDANLLHKEEIAAVGKA